MVSFILRISKIVLKCHLANLPVLHLEHALDAWTIQPLKAVEECRLQSPWWPQRRLGGIDNRRCKFAIELFGSLTISFRSIIPVVVAGGSIVRAVRGLLLLLG